MTWWSSVHDEPVVLAVITRLCRGRDELPLSEITATLRWEHNRTVAVVEELVYKGLIETDTGLGNEPTVIVLAAPVTGEA